MRETQIYKLHYPWIFHWRHANWFQSSKYYSMICLIYSLNCEVCIGRIRCNHCTLIIYFKVAQKTSDFLHFSEISLITINNDKEAIWIQKLNGWQRLLRKQFCARKFQRFLLESRSENRWGYSPKSHRTYAQIRFAAGW